MNAITVGEDATTLPEVEIEYIDINDYPAVSGHDCLSILNVPSPHILGYLFVRFSNKEYN